MKHSLCTRLISFLIAIVMVIGMVPVTVLATEEESQNVELHQEPLTAGYTVEHYQQNAEGTYDLKESETLEGTVGELTDASAKAYDGFEAKTFEQVSIVEEGTAVVAIYYDIKTVKEPVVEEPVIVTAAYTVEHYQQNAEGTYDLKESETLEGTVGELTDAAAKDYDGFEAKPFEQIAIAADGSTVVVIQYDVKAVVEEPTTAAYKVEHYLQTAEGYELKDTDNLEGTIGADTAAVAKDYDGFEAKAFEQIAIAADGTTVVVIQYDADPVTAEEEALTMSDVVTVISDRKSTLAPGIIQNLISAYDKNGDRVEMYVATADLSVDTVGVYANYKDNQNQVLGMSKTTEQVAAAEAKHEEPYNVVVAINASYYNMTTGKPTGTFVMEGNDITNEAEGNNYSFFAILKDGTPMIGAKGEYSSYKGQIAEAVGGYHHIVKDGKVYGNWASDTKKYPRQTVGVTADNKVIIMSADGNQAPRSVGLTMQEQAEVMIALGCVEAVHLDGGGSMTYCAKPEGADSIQILNKPSDGSERSVSNSLMFVSTAAPDGAFHHAVVTAEHDYVTPGSVVEVSAIGADATGNPAEIPDNAVWHLSDAAMGSVVNGVYTAAENYIGEAVVQLKSGETVIGSTIIHVVRPQKLEFNPSVITIPYGKSVPINVVATYGVNEVALKAEDIVFTLENDAMGTFNGFDFTACADESVAGGKVIVVLAADQQVKGEAEMVFGKGSDIILDFEDQNLGDMYIKTGYPQYGPKGSAKDEEGNYYYNGQNELGKLEIVTKDTGKVHNGDYSLAVECDFSQPYETGYHLLNLSGFKFEIPANAQAIGMWMYIPELEDIAATSVRFTGKTAEGGKVESPWLWDNCEPYGWSNDGWRYIIMNLADYKTDITLNALQFYICDRDNSDVNYYFKDHASVNGKFTFYIDDITIDYSAAVDDREPPVFSSLNYAVSGMADATTLNGQTVTSNVVSFSASVVEDTAKSNYTGIDAGSARAYVDGVSVGVSISGSVMTMKDQTLSDGVHTIRFEISDNMGNMAYIQRQIIVDAKSDIPTVSLVPQNPVADKILIGSVYWMNLETADAANIQSVTMKLNLNSVSQWELDHMIVTPGFKGTYSIDSVTNNATVTITKTGNMEDSVTVLAQLPIRTWESRLTQYTGYEDQTPAKLWSRKIIWPMDIKLSMNYGQISFVDGTSGSFSMKPIEVITELYGNYGELNAAGDYVNKNSWHVHTAEAIADKAATCTETGYTGRTFCAVCNSPVVWGTTKAATGHSYGMVDGVLKCKNACGKSFNGVHTDGKTYVDGVVIADGWFNNSYYVDGKPLTGIQKVPAADNSGEFYYDFGEDGQSKGAYNGMLELNGSLYYLTMGSFKNGWIIENDKYYYFGEDFKAVGGTDVRINGYIYSFDENKVLVKGMWTKDSNGGIRYVWADAAVNNQFREIEGKLYCFNATGFLLTGDQYVRFSHGDPYTMYYISDEGVVSGKMEGFNGLHKSSAGVFMVENGEAIYAGLVQDSEGNYYYINSGRKAVVNTSYSVSESKANGLLPAGKYEFDADGKMINPPVQPETPDPEQPAPELKQGLMVDEDGEIRFYVNGVAQYAGLVQDADGNYYYINSSKMAVKDRSYAIGASKTNDLLPAGTYSFGADGKMINVPKDEPETPDPEQPAPELKQGLMVDEDGEIRFYVNGVAQYAGLVQDADGNYYYINSAKKAVKDRSYAIGASKTNDLLPAGTYSFGADGKMINVPKDEPETPDPEQPAPELKQGLMVDEDGEIRFYVNGVAQYAGLVQDADGNYYYINSAKKAVKDRKYAIGASKTNGLLPAGTYQFGADGKMITA